MKEKYGHVVIKHEDQEYVRGAFDTNIIENFWSIVKRGIYGINHHVSPKHLNKYMDGFGYRYNTRHIKDCERFDLTLKKSNGRLTHKELVKN